jgi:predicted Zn finger-like uncharacterized protein
VSTIIECPACSTRYKMNKAIPEGGRSVKCARCGHQWRIAPEEPEELAEALDDELEEQAPGASQEQHPAAAEAAVRPESAPPAPQTIGEAWDVKPDHLAAGLRHEQHPAGPERAPAAPQTIGDAWDVRRGHLAAAIASMDGTPDTPSDETEADTGAGTPLADQPWQNPDAGFQGFGAGVEENSDALAGGPDDDESGERAGAPFAAAPAPAWATSPAWMAHAGRVSDSPEIDPETSVRLALRAAMDDDGSDAGAHGPEGGVSSVSRPVFSESASFEDTMAGVAAERADASEEPAAESGEPGKLRFASGLHGDFAPDVGPSKAKDRGAPAADPEASDDGEASENSEKFENDIVGIFRQQLQEKRSFGHAPSRKAAGDDFTDYDSDTSGSTEQADDRFLADSPLDADAAALQAALEGSLRERHTEENGGGGLALAAAWAVFLSVLSGVTLAFITFRDDMVVALPGTAALYRGIGFDVQDRRVDFGPVTYRWTVAEGKPMIEVTGQIINLTDHEIAVPRVLVNVHDKENTDMVKATATVRSDPLAAHEAADFTLEFLSPPKTITQIELAFAETE